MFGKNQQPATSNQQPITAPGLLFVLSAPSGAGKTSIFRELLALQTDLCESVSFTTRAVRCGEQEGVDYHFVSREGFDRMVHEGAFAEWAEVHGNCYGTAKATLQNACRDGRDLLLDIDVQGAEQLRGSGLDGVFIFILPPNMAELRQRLAGRNTDSVEVIERRMQNAASEILEAARFDYIVVNDDLPAAVKTVQAIVLAERVRRDRVIARLPAEFRLKS